MNSTANHDLPPFLAPKKAMITGIAGQDGSYLAELLFGKGYEKWVVMALPAGAFITFGLVIGAANYINSKLKKN